ncbi:MAG: LEPR-XLL domain-containing protein [Pseudomonadales bacterium]|nr:LEPR-XLL domain-containing protein [Pseudomonadales bacterium]NRA17368.1 LEPR-XLL domain-containing protein [Oceanospirillaceae bacterium]
MAIYRSTSKRTVKSKIKNLAEKFTLPKPRRLISAIERANSATRHSAISDLFKQNAFQLEQLEPRLLLSADPLAVALAADADVSLQVQERAGQQYIQLIDNNASSNSPPLFEIDISMLNPGDVISISATDSHDSLTVDKSYLDLGEQAFVVQFDGGGGTDSLTLSSDVEQSTWQINGDNQGSLGTGGSVEFLSIEEIQANNSSAESSHLLSAINQSYQWLIQQDNQGLLASLEVQQFNEIPSASTATIKFSGFDTLVGSGPDQLNYSVYATGVDVDLEAGTATGFIEVSGFQTIVGSAYDDRLVGDTNDNNFVVDFGDEVAGAGGYDTLIYHDLGATGIDVSLVGDAKTNFTLARGDWDGNNFTTDTGSDIGIITAKEIDFIRATGGSGDNYFDFSTAEIQLFLDGGAGDDHLLGGSEDDLFTGGSGGDFIDGGGHTTLLGDELIELRAANFTVVGNELTVGSDALDSLVNIQSLYLRALSEDEFGVKSGRTLDARGADEFNITLVGTELADSLFASDFGDSLIGNAGADTLTGGAGIDTFSELFAGRAILSSDAGSGGYSVDLAQGDNEKWLLSKPSSISGNGFTLSITPLSGVAVVTDEIVWESTDTQVASAIEQALDLDYGHVYVLSTDTGWQVEFFGLYAAQQIATLLTADSLVTATISQEATTDIDSLLGFSQEDIIELHGSYSADWVDVSDYQGQTIINTYAGRDTIKVGSGFNTVNAGAGNDTIYLQGNSADEIDAGSGIDRLIVDLSADDNNHTITLENHQLTIDAYTVVLQGVESVAMLGSSAIDIFDASAFHGVSASTELANIQGWSELTEHTLTISLADTDGTIIDVNLSKLESIQDILDLLNSIDDRDTGALTGSFDQQNARIEITGLNHLTVAGSSLLVLDVLGLTGGIENSALSGMSLSLLAGIQLTSQKGNGGNDRLTGSKGRDSFSLGLGASTVVGGAGVDTLSVSTTSVYTTLELSDGDLTWKDDSTVNPDVIASFSQIGTVILNATFDAKLLDASSVTAVLDVVLDAGTTTAELRSGLGNNQLKVNIDGRSEKVLATIQDSAEHHQVIFYGGGAVLSSTDFDWMTFNGATNYDYQIDRSGDLAINEKFSLDGRNVTITTTGTLTINKDVSTSSSSGDAYDLTFKAKDIIVADGVTLSALGSSGNKHGHISLLAKDVHDNLNGLGFYNADSNSASIEVKNAIIIGGNITLFAFAESDARRPVEKTGDRWQDRLAKLEKKAVRFLENFSLLFSYASENVKATVTIAKDALITGENISIQATVMARVTANPTSTIGAVAIGDLTSDAEVNIQGSIIANNINILSQTFNYLEVKAVPLSWFASKAGGFSGSVAIGSLDTTTLAVIADSANIIVSGDFSLRAQTFDFVYVLAESDGPDEGTVSIGVAVHLETGSTTASLFGKVLVQGNVTVEAIQLQGKVNGKSGTVVIASADRAFSKIKDSKYNKQTWLSDTSLMNTLRLSKLLAPSDSKSSTKLTLGLAFAYATDTNTVRAYIGDDAAASDIQIGGALQLSASADARLLASAASVSNSPSQTSSSGESVSQVAFGGAASVIINSLNNDVLAQVQGDTQLDVLGKISIESSAENVTGLIDTDTTINYVEPTIINVDTLAAAYDIETGDVIQFDDRHYIWKQVGEDKRPILGFSFLGGVYKYKGADNDQLQLDSQNYADPQVWERLGDAISSQKALLFDGVSDIYLFDNQATSIAAGAKVSIALNFMYLDSQQTALSKVLSGAKINQRATAILAILPTTVVNRDLDIISKTINKSVDYVGNATDSKNPILANAHHLPFFNKDKNNDSNASYSGNGVGASVFISTVTTNSQALIEENTQVRANQITLEATSDVFGVSAGKAAASGSASLGIAGLYLSNTINSTVIAQIDSNSTIEASAGLNVTANNKVNFIVLAGGKGSGATVAVGAAAAVTDITKLTKAHIGSIDSSATPLGSVSVDGDVVVKAVSEGFVISVAGSMADADGKNTPSGQDEVETVNSKYSLSVAGAFIYNYADFTTDASVANLSSFSAAKLSVSAEETSGVYAFPIAYSSAESNKVAVAIAGVVLINDVNITLSAGVQKISTLELSELSINATNNSTIITASAALAKATIESTSAGSSSSVALTGNVAINDVINDIDAYLNDIDTMIVSGANAEGFAVDVSAKDAAEIYAFAVGLAYSGAFAVGVTVAENNISTDTDALIANLNLSLENGSVKLSADSDTDILSIAVGASIVKDSAATSSTKVSLSLAAAVSSNKVIARTKAKVDNAILTLQSNNAGLAITSTDNSHINVVAVAASASVQSGGQGTSISLSGAGASATNAIYGDTQALLSNSNIPDPDAATNGTYVSLEAQATGFVSANVIAATLALTSSSSGTGVAGAIGVSLAENNLGDNDSGAANVVAARISNTAIEVSGGVSVTAKSTQTIISNVVAVAVGLAKSTSGAAGALTGVGASANNTIKVAISATVSSDTGRSLLADSFYIFADDTSKISAVVFGASVAGSSSSTKIAGALSIAVSLAQNSVENNVLASVDGVLLGSASQRTAAVTVKAKSNATIYATSAAAALAASYSGSSNSLALSGAGANADNSIMGSTSARIIDSTIYSAAAVLIEADNSSRIEATVVAASLAVGLSSGAASGAVGIGAALAGNDIGVLNDVFSIEALLQDSSIDTSGSLTVKATNDMTIISDVVAASMAVAGSSSGASLSGAGSGVSSINHIFVDTTASVSTVDDSKYILVTSLNVKATDTSKITVVAIGASLAASYGSTVGAALAIGVALAENEVNSNTAAYIEGVAQINSGTVTLNALADNTIIAEAYAASLAVGLSGAGGALGISGAGADANNEIYGSTQAYVSGAQLGTSAAKLGNVIVDAENISNISSTVVAVSAAAAVGSTGAAGISIGAAITDNQIGSDTKKLNVIAYIKDSSIYSADLSIAASNDMTITAEVGAGSAAVAASTGFGAAGAGSGVGTTNQVYSSTLAYIDNSSDNDDIVVAAKISVSAINTAKITATAASASLALGLSSGLGVAISVGVSVAKNEIYNQVEAKVIGLRASNVQILSESLAVLAKDTSTIKATLVGVSVGFAGGATGLSLSIGAAEGINKVANTVIAHIESIDVETVNGGISVNAEQSSKIDMSAEAASVSMAGGSVGVGVAGAGVLGENDINNITKAYVENARLTTKPRADYQETDEIQQLANGQLVEFAGGVYRYNGANIDLRPDYASDGFAYDNSGNTVGVEHTVVNPQDKVIFPSGTYLYQGSSVVSLEDAISAIDSGTYPDWEALDHYIDLAALKTESPGSFSQVYNTAQYGLQNIDVLAKSSAKIISTVGAAAGAAGVGAGAGAAAIGVTLAENTIGNDSHDGHVTQAYVNNSSLLSLNDINVNATSISSIDSSVYGASVAVAGGTVALAGAGVGINLTNKIYGTTQAYVDSTDMLAANKISINADADGQILKADAVAAAVAVAVGLGGAVSISVTLIDNDIAMHADAYLNLNSSRNLGSSQYQVLAENGLDVIAHGNAEIKDVDATAVTFSAGLFGASGGGVDIDNQVNNLITADVMGSGAATSGGEVKIDANETTKLSANVTNIALSASIGGALGVALVRNDVRSQISSRIKDSKIDAQDISLTASADNNISKTQAFGFAAALGAASANRADVAITTTVKVTTDVATLNAVDSLTLYATAKNIAFADASGGAVGAVAAGAMIAQIEQGSTNVDEVLVQIGDNSSLSAVNISIKAFGDDTLLPVTVAGAGGFVAGAGAQSDVTSKQAVIANIGKGVSITATGFDLSSKLTQKIDASADALSLGLTAGGGAGLSIDIDTKADVNVGASTNTSIPGILASNISAHDITINTLNSFDKSEYDNAKSLSTGSASLASVAVLLSDTNLNNSSKINLSDNVELLGLGSYDDKATIRIDAKQDINTIDNITLETFSFIGGANAATSQITATSNTAVNLNGAKIENITGAVYITAKTDSENRASADVLAISGLSSAAGGTALVTTYANNSVSISNADIKVGDLYIYAGKSSQGVLNLLESSANVELTSVSVGLNVSVPAPSANIVEINLVTIGANADIKSMTDVTIEAREGKGGGDRASESGLMLSLSLVPYGSNIDRSGSVYSSNNFTIDASASVIAGVNNLSFLQIRPTAEIQDILDRSGVVDAQGVINIDLLTDFEKEQLFGVPDADGHVVVPNLPTDAVYVMQALAVDKINFRITQDTVVHHGTQYYKYLPQDSVEVELQGENYSNISRWKSLGASLSTDQVARYNVYESAITDELAEAMTDEFYVIKPKELESPTLTFTNLSTVLFEQRAQVLSWLRDHGSNAEAVARYQVQLAQIDQKIEALGLSDYTHTVSDGQVIQLANGKFYESKINQEAILELADYTDIDLWTEVFSPSNFWSVADTGHATGQVYNQALDILIIDLPDIYASPGSVYLQIDGKAATSIAAQANIGNLQAREGATIQISNSTSFSLRVNDVVVQDTQRVELVGGSLKTFTPGAVQINYQDANSLAIRGAQTPAGSAATMTNEIVIYQNPGVDARQTYGAFTLPDIPQNMYIQGNVVNENGGAFITNRAGSIEVSTQIRAETVNVFAAGDFTLNSDAWFHTNQDPRKYIKYQVMRDKVWNEAGNYASKNFSSEQVAGLDTAILADTSQILSMGKITLTAQYLNVNGLIQSGVNTVYLTVAESFYGGARNLDFVNKKGQSLAGISFTDPTTNVAVPVSGYWDAANQAIVIDDIAPSGGEIVIAGQILSTGNGRIVAASGYASVFIENNSGYDLVLNDLDTREYREGKITIIDSQRLSKDEYQYNGAEATHTQYKGELVSADPDTGEISKIVYSEVNATISSEPNAFVYKVTAGSRYVWTEGQEKTKTTVYKYEKKSFNLFGDNEFADFLVADTSYTWKNVEFTDKTPLLESESVLTLSSGPKPDSADYTVTYQQTDGNSSVNGYDKDTWTTGGGWLRQKTVHTKLTTIVGLKDYYTHSLKADYDININFLGSNATPNVNIVSAGNIIFSGKIKLADAGSLNVTSVNGSINMADGVYALTEQASFQAYGDINIILEGNSAARGNSIVSDAGSISLGVVQDDNPGEDRFGNALTSSNMLYINQISAKYSVDINAGGGIYKASVGQSTSILANSINLTTLGGEVGSNTRALSIDSARLNSAGTVTVNAQGHVALTEVTGNLNVNSILAALQDDAPQDSGVYGVQLTAVDGYILDANTDETRTAGLDTRTAQRFYAETQISGAANDDTTLYHQYWQILRNDVVPYQTDVNDYAAFDSLFLELPEAATQAETDANLAAAKLAVSNYHNSISSADRYDRSYASDPDDAGSLATDLYHKYWQNLRTDVYLSNAADYANYENLFSGLLGIEKIQAQSAIAALNSTFISSSEYDQTYDKLAQLKADNGSTDPDNDSQFKSDVLVKITENLPIFNSILSPGIVAKLYPGTPIIGGVGATTAEVANIDVWASGSQIVLSAKLGLGNTGDRVSINMADGVDNLTNDERILLSQATGNDVVATVYDFYRYKGGNATTATSVSQLEIDYANTQWQGVSTIKAITTGITTLYNGDLVEVDQDGIPALFQYTGSVDDLDLNDTNFEANGAPWERVVTQSVAPGSSLELLQNEIVMQLESVTIQLWDDLNLKGPASLTAVTTGLNAGIALEHEGDLKVNVINGSAWVRLSIAGNLIDTGSASNAAILSAGDLVLITKGNIQATNGSALRIQVANAGQLSVDATGSVNLWQVEGSADIAGATHAISHLNVADIAAVGNITIGAGLLADSEVSLASGLAPGGSADIVVEKISTSTGVVSLLAAHDILDAIADSASAIINIRAQSLVLLAGNGIGNRQTGINNYLDIKLTGAVKAKAQGDIYLNAVEKDLRVDYISSQATVTLKATKSILDAQSDNNNQLLSLVGDSDISAKSISLNALKGGIGQYGNQLEIDTDASNSGVLNSYSALNTYIGETVGDLILGNLVADSDNAGAADADIYLVGAASINNGATSGINITAGHVSIIAAANIGENSAISSKINYLEAQADSGAIDWLNTGHLQLGDVTNLLNGVSAASDINIAANSPLTVLEGVLSNSGDISLTATDSAASTDILTFASTATVEANLGSITLNAGDDLIVEQGASLKANTSLVLNTDLGNADSEAATVALYGKLSAVEIQINTGAGNDQVLLDVQQLTGDTVVNTGDGDDLITVNQLHSRADKLQLDGGQGSDSYVINRTANNAGYVIDVLDTGLADSGADTLTINGTSDADSFLLRANFVAALHLNANGDYAATFERINYNGNINARLTINGQDGNDHFFSDDNSSITTLDGGAGVDNFQIGQLFADDRLASLGNVALDDQINTTETTLGFLSFGNSLPMVIYGGDGRDTIKVYSNKSTIKLYGEDGNDNFVVRAFLQKGSQLTAGGGDVELFGGDGDDNIQYSINSPLSIDGGNGTDTVVVLGTEADDSFMITDKGIFGAGLNVGFTGVELAEVDGLEGDDTFYVLSTNADMVTTIIGGLGADTFNIAGDVTTPIVSYSVEGRSSFINHSVASADGAYNGIFVNGLALNVADSKNGAVKIDAVDGQLEVNEGKIVGDSYQISMDVAEPTLATLAFITVSAARASSSDKSLLHPGGDSADSVLVSVDNINFYESLVIRVDSASNWTDTHNVYVRAVDDTAAEGRRDYVISHSIGSENSDFDGLNIANIEVTVNDNDKADLIVTSSVNPLAVEDGVSQTFNVRLATQPAVGETVTVALAEIIPTGTTGQLRLDTASLTFNSSNWDQLQSFIVSAEDDVAVENLYQANISLTTSSDGVSNSDYDNLADVQVNLMVVDNDSGAVIVTATNGSTIVSNSNTDDYTLSLSKKPTAAVTISLLNDQQVLVTNSSGDSRFNSVDNTVTFGINDWDQAIILTVSPNPSYQHDQDKQPVQKVVLQPHTLDKILGKLIIDGGVPADKQRSLISAVMLPTELDGELIIESLATDESKQTDRLHLFNDGSVQNNVDGVLTATSITGLGMGVGHGIEYTNIEVLETYLGIGNDEFEVAGTAAGSISVIHGGGGDDTLTVTGSNSDSALILLGDSVQDGSSYSATSDQKTAFAREFNNPGNDIIDASGAGGSVVIFGGQGNDQLTGSEFDDHIAGGSGEDTIFGLGGNDHIYGDSGINLDLSVRLDLSTQVLHIVNTADAANDNPETADNLVVSRDIIDGGAGNDIIFADKGIITQLANTNRILTTAAVINITNTNRDAGGDDSVLGGSGNDLIIGGLGRDTIAGDSGNDLIIGDHGSFELLNDVVTKAYSSSTDSGNIDDLSGDSGNDTLIGGFAGDILAGGAGNDTVIGDNGQVEYVDGIRRKAFSTDLNGSTGGNDTISLGTGEDQAIGGVGADRITNTAGETLIIGDDGEIFSDASGRYISARTGNTGIGGADTITGGSDRDIIFGGFGGDWLDGAAGDDIIGGDGSQITRKPDNIIFETIDLFVGGDDTLLGGAGLDRMMGAFGSDLFYADFREDIFLGEYGRFTFASNPAGGEQATFIISLAQGGLDLIRQSQTDLFENFAQQVFAQSDLGLVARGRTAIVTQLSTDAEAALGRLNQRPAQHSDQTAVQLQPDGVDFVIPTAPTAAGTESAEEQVGEEELLYDEDGFLIQPDAQATEIVEGEEGAEAVDPEAVNNPESSEETQCVEVEGEPACETPATTDQAEQPENPSEQQQDAAELERALQKLQNSAAANDTSSINLQATLASFSGWALMGVSKSEKAKRKAS